jgi:hypothetical protein
MSALLTAAAIASTNTFPPIKRPEMIIQPIMTALEDHLGSIADELLFSKNNGLLNHITFPQHGSNPGSSEIGLHNRSTGDSLTINTNNIILDMNFSEKIPKERAGKLIDEYFKALTEKIYKIVNIREIRMVGLVHKYIIDDESNAGIIHKKIKEITFDDASLITVNFSKKNILPESKIKKGYNDYKNVICTLSMTHERKQEYFFQVDYQHFYDPRLDSIIDIPYGDFVKKVIYYNTALLSGLVFITHLTQRRKKNNIGGWEGKY